jgi:hypothetical protein
MKKLIPGSRSSGRDLNRRPPEYEAGVFTIQARRSVNTVCEGVDRINFVQNRVQWPVLENCDEPRLFVSDLLVVEFPEVQCPTDRNLLEKRVSWFICSSVLHFPHFCKDSADRES